MVFVMFEGKVYRRTQTERRNLNCCSRSVLSRSAACAQCQGVLFGNEPVVPTCAGPGQFGGFGAAAGFVTGSKGGLAHPAGRAQHTLGRACGLVPSARISRACAGRFLLARYFRDTVGEWNAFTEVR